MKSRIFVFFFALLFLNASSQDFSNKGTDFWLCFPSHVPSGANNIAKMALFITSNQNTSGTIQVGSFSTTFSVTANQISGPIDIPYSVAHISRTESGTPVNKGIHVQVDAGKPAIVLYAHVYASARSEASLILPTNVLGRKYYSMNYIQNNQAADFFSQFNVVAVEANTTVKYQLRKNGVLDNTVVTKSLPNVGDVLQIQDKSDLTGSIIESTSSTGASCKKIAVFSGSSAVNIGLSNGVTTQPGSSTDPLFQQCYPVNTWGKNFGLVPFVTAASPYHYRVLASEDNTTVSIDGANVTLNAGEFYPSFPGNLQQVPVNKPFVISSDKPVSVAQYMLSSNVNGYGSNNGDPEMILLNPIEQNIADISVFSSKLELIRAQYINIFTLFNNIASFKINGAAPRSSFVRMPAPNDRYAYLIEDLTTYSTNSFRITSDSGFNGICYGIGNVESYGYSAGTSVKDFTKVASFQNANKRLDSAIACVNTPFEFSVPLSNIPSSITWDFGAAPNITPNTKVGPQANPVFDSTTTAGGQTIYYFSNKIPYSFTKSNTSALRDTIKVYTTSSTPDGCGSTEQTYLIPVKVSPLPSADFTYTATCVTDSVRFVDATNTGSESFVEKAIWTFDDGTTGSEANPVKKYALPGTYNVRYQPISSYGCVGDITKQVAVSTAPQASFTVSPNTCAGNQVTLTDATQNTSGTMVKWTWNFGEGPSVTNTTNAPVSHTYNNVGRYTATLQVETSTGCKSSVFTKEIIISANPVVDFSFPVVICLPGGETQFTNKSTISDGSALTYSWNFGDNQTSTERDPLHKYNSTGPFDVKLTVTSNQGCTKNLGKTVNTILPQPRANFNVSSEVCLGDSTSFTDISNGSGSNVVQWRWNFGDGVTSTLQNPKHLYTSDGSRTVTLSIVTDKGCVSDTATKTTVVNALPYTDFLNLAPACETKEITFVAVRGVANAGTINRWSWNFGDGSTVVTRQSPLPFTHTYSASGVFNISLEIETDRGCKQTFRKPITINPQPTATFILPEVCLNDAFAQFTDSSTIADGSQSAFTYLWNFGDNNATPSNPNTSTSKDPRHKYSAVGNYNVSLTVTSKDGCSSTSTKSFTVNGSTPIANFDVLNSSTLCSNTKVDIQNTSTVDFGSLTKVEIFWDAAGAPTSIVTDDNPSQNKIYSFNYPATSTTKDYQVKFRAYSGGTCINEVTKTIRVNGSPDANFTSIPNVCIDVNAFQISQASEATGIAGSFAFAGNGVSPSGMFNPKTAGAGQTRITYTYTTAAGCKDTASQTITVLQNPQVNAGPDLFVLESGSTMINATATGDNLTFVWSPGTYLDNTSTLTPRVTPTSDITYKITATTAAGCSASDQVFVKVLLAPEVPNAFSPNKDGINDTWDIRFLETYPGAVIEVFNRYGQVVFRSTGYTKQWDGTLNGNPLPVGVYYYIIDPKNGRKPLTGSLTILR